jgi:hypothetical protein
VAELDDSGRRMRREIKGIGRKIEHSSFSRLDGGSRFGRRGSGPRQHSDNEVH